MASGAMPPGFPAVNVEEELYWDGGCVSNTPLDGIYDRVSGKDTLCFVIDLFGPTDEQPRDICQVLLKQKEIQYSSRLKRHMDQVKDRHNLAHSLQHDLRGSASRLARALTLARVPESSAKARFDLVHILYRKPPSEVPTCDCEFSASSIRERAEQGYRDMAGALERNRQEHRRDEPVRKRELVGSVLRTFASGRLVESSLTKSVP